MKRQAHGRATGIHLAMNLAGVGMGSVYTKSVQRGTRITDSTRNTHNLIGESQPACKAKVPDRQNTVKWRIERAVVVRGRGRSPVT